MKDPESNSFLGLHSHGPNHKGSKSVNLLNYIKNTPLPAGTKHFDMMNKNARVPALKTVYWCTPFKMSNLVNLKSKQHIIEIAPMIQKRPAALVHHILVYGCNTFDEAALGYSGPCYDHDTPASISACTGISTIVAWGVGGTNIKFPKEAGLPIGVSYSYKYVVMTTHFNNVLQRGDFVDSSGFRFFYSSPRKYDAGMLRVGSNFTSEMIIPPHQKNWITTTYCTKDCTMNVKDPRALNGNTIKIFSSMPHAHLTANAIWTAQIRNGIEVAEIFRVDNFDFNFQQTYMLRKPIEFRAGDELITYCRRNTMHRKYATTGGLGSHKEMCLNFLMYYPRVDFTSCTNDEPLVAERFAPKYGQEIWYTNNKPSRKTDWTGIKWTSKMVTELRNIYKSKSKKAIEISCIGGKPFDKREPRPVIRKKLPKPRNECRKNRKKNVYETMSWWALMKSHEH